MLTFSYINIFSITDIVQYSKIGCITIDSAFETVDEICDTFFGRKRIHISQIK